MSGRSRPNFGSILMKPRPFALMVSRTIDNHRRYRDLRPGRLSQAALLSSDGRERNSGSNLKVRISRGTVKELITGLI